MALARLEMFFFPKPFFVRKQATATTFSTFAKGHSFTYRLTHLSNTLIIVVDSVTNVIYEGKKLKRLDKVLLQNKTFEEMKTFQKN